MYSFVFVLFVSLVHCFVRFNLSSFVRVLFNLSPAPQEHLTHVYQRSLVEGELLSPPARRRSFHFSDEHNLFTPIKRFLADFTCMMRVERHRALALSTPFRLLSAPNMIFVGNPGTGTGMPYCLLFLTLHLPSLRQDTTGHARCRYSS